MLVINQQAEPPKYVEQTNMEYSDFKITEYGKIIFEINPVNDLFQMSFYRVLQKLYQNYRINAYINGKLKSSFTQTNVPSNLYYSIYNKIDYEKFGRTKWSDVKNLYAEIYGFDNNEKPILLQKVHIVNNFSKISHPRELVMDDRGATLHLIKAIQITDSGISVDRTALKIKPSKIENYYTNNEQWFEFEEGSNFWGTYKPQPEIKKLTGFNLNGKDINVIPYVFAEKKRGRAYWYIRYSEHTKYDYNQGTILTTEIGSDRGYILPYNFSGNFSPKLTFNISRIKDLTVSYNINVEKPILNKENGIIKLNLNEQNSIKNVEFTKKYFEIDYKDFNKIIKLKNGYLSIINYSGNVNKAEPKWKEEIVLIHKDKKDEKKNK